MTNTTVAPTGYWLVGDVLLKPSPLDVLSRRAPLAHPAVYPPVALVVPRVAGDEVPVQRALEDEGWFVKTCAGPGRTDCPLMGGVRCPVRESADAAIVFVDPAETPRALGTTPRVRCASASGSPAVLALENRLDPPQYAGGTATVGSLRGPDGMLTAISTLLGARQAGE